jgi:hypothetical protein
MVSLEGRESLESRPAVSAPPFLLNDSTPISKALFI